MSRPGGRGRGRDGYACWTPGRGVEAGANESYAVDHGASTGDVRDVRILQTLKTIGRFRPVPANVRRPSAIVAGNYELVPSPSSSARDGVDTEAASSAGRGLAGAPSGSQGASMLAGNFQRLPYHCPKLASSSLCPAKGLASRWRGDWRADGALRAHATAAGHSRCCAGSNGLGRSEWSSTAQESIMTKCGPSTRR